MRTLIFIALALAPLAAQSSLSALNKAFRDEYSRAKKEALVHGGPVLLVDGDRMLMLRHNQQTAEAIVRPNLYHHLKAMSHIPLALYVMLKPGSDEPLAADRIEVLKRFRILVAAASTELTEAIFPGGLLARQKGILDGSLQLLNGAIQDRRLSQIRLATFIKDMRPQVLANATDAAGAQLERLQATVSQWRGTLSPEEWQSLHVVIIGAHMPREGEVSWQYFSRLLGESTEGGRIVYAESLWSATDAMDLLATHLVDTAAAEAFFDEPHRLHRDLLADAARIWLGTHPGRP